ncbi:XRE family transcriptional regulator [Tenacibaculum maritimum]|uniref:XRE family transcriptional regulator n=1 Tax=Tenacibaculum maritimum TaxID=107401 RepID=UPI0012E4FE05|nr:XRE family transcriptional regulator [Tenacibaculum maritimum]MCD9583174.1 XRE family transcriptional regulator [Tenacibaculum maritimum]MCD9637339.1 XRE family transcriptional regulator [Tenacibaculum maritimum]MDB0601206.1 XRE family transcriptional regulator [Tenacibaculum maritimum]MDB0613555.1 XRE family transcriptional regulator [Tenacibaculum maritimum]CAA0144820.1 XRE family transcriptional regulator [Tenacibaculum maritimum]
MNTIAEKIQALPQTHYQKIAKKFNTSTDYVGQIARGKRIPTRGKGLQIQEALKELIKN